MKIPQSPAHFLCICYKEHYFLLLSNIISIFYLLLDEPKCPGPVEIEQTVHGKVAISWAPSPDEELDDRLYYVVAQRDSNTRIWKTVADRLTTHTYTAINILPGIEYHFRVYAKNDMGLSDPSQSPTWGVNSNKGELVIFDYVTANQTRHLPCTSFIISRAKSSTIVHSI